MLPTFTLSYSSRDAGAAGWSPTGAVRRLSPQAGVVARAPASRPSLNISDAGELYKTSSLIRKHAFKYNEATDERATVSEHVDSSDELMDDDLDAEWELVATIAPPPPMEVVTNPPAPKDDPDEWAFVSTDDKKPPFLQALLKTTVGFTHPPGPSQPAALPRPPVRWAKAHFYQAASPGGGVADDEYWRERASNPSAQQRGKSSRSSSKRR